MPRTKELTLEELPGYIGRNIIIQYKDKEETLELVNVKGDLYSVKIKRNDEWDGIEPWYIFGGDVKIFVNE